MGWPTQTSTNLVFWLLNIVVWQNCDERIHALFMKRRLLISLWSYMPLIMQFHWFLILAKKQKPKKTSTFVTSWYFLETSEINATLFYPEHVTHLDSRFHFRMFSSQNCTLFCHYLRSVLTLNQVTTTATTNVHCLKGVVY